jgi:hypothetical protein
MSKRALFAALMAALTLAGTAAGYTAGRVFAVRPGDSADFSGKRGVNGWRCNNIRGQYARCFSGDAYPYVRLTGTLSGGVTVKVYTLRGFEGRLTRTYEGRQPVYVFTASP